MNRQTTHREPSAPAVSLDMARVFPSWEYAEAYIDRTEPALCAVLPFPGGAVVGHLDLDGSILGYEA